MGTLEELSLKFNIPKAMWCGFTNWFPPLTCAVLLNKSSMLGTTGARRYYLYGRVTDMRKSFNGLSGLVINKMKGDLLSGDAFIFINRRHNMMKILVWDRTGFVIYYKRLEKGTFEMLSAKGSRLEIDWADLVMILEGVRLKSMRRRARYAV
ncbi:MAG: IS66 family insertion sequence hypothetical protein [Bacteroidetes bacterium]|nr:MAG: IS66 family insertion sequence hypothetical protein [Bacteroidota bacterium]